MNEGQWEDASGIIKEAKHKTSYNISLQISEIKLHLRKGNIQPLGQIFSENKSAISQNFSYFFMYIQYLTKTGQFKKAIKYLNTVGTDSNHWLANKYGVLGDIYFNTYRYPQAINAFKKSLEHKDSAKVTNRLALLYVLQEELQLAKETLHRATETLLLKSASSKVIVPLRSHSAAILNEFRTQPHILALLIRSWKLPAKERMDILVDIISEKSTVFRIFSNALKRTPPQWPFQRNV